MKKRHFNFFILIFAAVIGYFSYIAIKQQIYINNISSEQSMIQQQLDTVLAENRKLSAEKKSLQDPKYIEKIARNELGMTKKGEIPYIASSKK
ncbi:FtsB family cell division protein [Pectinatus sottacetonis]|uniref:FtsB family cell division protein n=1 Tax=Pectinatus sottacetonis TaxID=1002795 RepID=UPI0018C6325C|nr:septum formation initiator family protein [Pectinatus sottacetonis]